MFLGFLITVGVVVGLTLLGAFISRRSAGDTWHDRDDRPMMGPDHH